MTKSVSPLRYPGGKLRFYNYVNNIINENSYGGCTYIEPFAGGCGLALKLLFNNDVKRIVINDLDRAIYGFWHFVLNDTDELISKIRSIDITIEEREIQKLIYSNPDLDLHSLGFSAFFLNRVNHSGVIKGGPIGGKKQNGTFKLNARFNKERLIDNIKNIRTFKEKIFLSNFDATEMLTNGYLHQFKRTFINFDPPYVVKGSQLYKNSFQTEDHIALSKVISRVSRKWIVTYDKCDLVMDLYKDFPHRTLPVSYSAGNTKKSEEYIFFNHNVVIPDSKHP